MNRKKLILIGLAATSVLLVLTVVVLASSRKPATPRPMPTLIPTTPSPTASAQPVNLVVPEDGDKEVNDFRANFPVVQKLPTSNKYWGLAVAGALEDGKIPLKAVVYVLPNENADQLVAQQKPYIEQWIQKTGQKSGTYVLRISTDHPDTY